MEILLPEVCPGQVLEHLHVRMLEELLEAVLVHLYGRDILPLLHVDVTDIQPNIAEVRRGLSHLHERVQASPPIETQEKDTNVHLHLGEYIPGLLRAALMSQHGTDAVRRPDVLVVVPQDRLVHRQGSVLQGGD